MSHTYNSVDWNRQKRVYDLTMAACVVVYLALFVGLGLIIHPYATIETLLIRALGTCALLMLSVALIIGPLARLSPRFLPLLYNRRHLGVATFLVALAHGCFAVFQFHALGELNPLVSVFVSNTRYTSLSNFPFQPLGLIALLILFLMAATSHDFWLVNLTAPVWKRLHMLVYVAYALVVAHVLLGVLQAETNPLFVVLLGAGVALTLGLHLVAGFRERRRDEEIEAAVSDNYVDVCGLDEIPEKRACVATLSGERVAIFKYDGKISALSNICQHQNGPLGEGRIIEGCVTCPWHGYQYLPESGASPPPFTEKVPTFNVKVVNGRVLVDPRPNAPGTYTEPATISQPEPEMAPNESEEFYIGYLPEAPAGIARRARKVVIAIAIVAVSVAVLIVTGQRRFAASFFDFGNVREFEGVINEYPVPTLIVQKNGQAGTLPSLSYFALVAEGKHSAAALVEGFDGKYAKLRGTLIHRDDMAMIEVAPDSIRIAKGSSDMMNRPVENLGEFTLAGEIVDSKCYLGVMNPGHTKPHRECASLCVRGGVPPLFIVRDAEDRSVALWLVSDRGLPVNEQVLDFVAEPIEITGHVSRSGDQLFLRADPKIYRRAR